MPKPQIIYHAGKKAFAVIPWADYVRLAGRPETMSDEAIFDAAIAAGAGEEGMPGEVVKRLIKGENPIKVFREHRGLTQADLARAAGTGALYVSQIETGVRTGSVDLLKRIAVALGVDLDDLVPSKRARRRRPARSRRSR